MVETTSARVERRRNSRIVMKGSVVVRAGNHVHHGRLADLSQGGLLAVTDVSPPQRLLGSTVELDLRLDAQAASWVRIAGRAVRVGPDHLAVAFSQPPSALVQLIDDMTAASRTRRRVIHVVLLDNDLVRREALAEGFRAAGCNVIDVATPLEAVVRLGESSFEPDVIAIADSAAEVADEMRRFTQNAHPRAQLVTIGDGALAPGGATDWLSSIDSGDDLAVRVRRILGQARL
jgi:hypothetical protein